METMWNGLKMSIEETIEEVVPQREKRAKQHWMTDDILDLMNERRSKKTIPK